jgi:ABC-type transport system involved in cytochrome bd biosynthesis fused ATPase/permease subunit
VDRISGFCESSGGGRFSRTRFVRQAPIVILDKPTSAVDLGAEADWLRRFRDLPRDAPLY